MRGINAFQGLGYELLSAADLATAADSAFASAWPATMLSRQQRLAPFLGLESGTEGAGAMPTGTTSPAVFAASAGVLVASTSPLSPDGALRAACAFDRQLVAQTFADASPDGPGQPCPGDVDACLARRALFAGDAALLAEQWWRTFAEDRSALPEAPVTCAASPPTGGVTPATVAGLWRFPAEQGLSFVRALYLSGGWAAVDSAYRTPPLTTEQILHPERYAKDIPRPPELSDLATSLGPGWTTQDSGTLGEWSTLLALLSRLEPADAAKAATGWDGDAYAVISNPDQGLMAWLLLTRWDSVRDAHEFFGAFRTYGEDRFGASRRTSTSLIWELPSSIVALYVGNDQTLWIEAPDASSAEALRRASRFPIY